MDDSFLGSTGSCRVVCGPDHVVSMPGTYSCVQSRESRVLSQESRFGSPVMQKVAPKSNQNPQDRPRIWESSKFCATDQSLAGFSTESCIVKAGHNIIHFLCRICH